MIGCQVFWSLLLAIAFLYMPGLAEIVGLIHCMLVFRRNLF
jgi:hypothetical protein